MGRQTARGRERYGRRPRMVKQWECWGEQVFCVEKAARARAWSGNWSERFGRTPRCIMGGGAGSTVDPKRLSSTLALARDYQRASVLRADGDSDEPICPHSAFVLFLVC